MPASPEVSVVVPSRGAWATLPALVAALDRQTLSAERFEVIVVDAGADGGIRMLEGLRDRYPGLPLRVARGPFAGGPGARRNHGAALARGGLLAFTDADCQPDPGWLAAGLAAHRGGAQMVQGPTIPPPGDPDDPFWHAIRLDGPSPLYEGCNMFYDRSLFHRVGGFSTRYFPRFMIPFGEDVELGWRARRAGAAPAFSGDALVHHAVVRWPFSTHLRREWLARGFPLLVRDVPELRAAFLHRRYFLSRRSLRFAAAVAGLLLARRLPLTALAVLPYIRTVAAEQDRVGGAARRVAADAVLAAGLAAGSLRWRRLVL